MIDPNAVRSGLAPAIEQFAQRLRASAPKARVDLSWWSNERFPLSCTVAVSEAEPAGDEVVVLTVAVWTDGIKVVLSSDLARGDGQILGDGPRVERAIGAVDQRSVEQWMRDTQVFVTDAAPKATLIASDRGL
jgi:hypothetical protein